jgi:hypothetical protein
MIRRDNITNHVEKVQNTMQVFKDTGQLIVNEMIITKIVCSFPPSYNNIVVAWDNLPTIARTIRRFTTRLLK